MLITKLVVDFLLVNELFSLGERDRGATSEYRLKIAVFEDGWASLNQKIQVEGDVAYVLHQPTINK